MPKIGLIIFKLKCISGAYVSERGENLLITSLCLWYWGNISSRFSNKSEAFSSERLENLKEMFPLYWQ